MLVTNVRISFLREKQPAQYEKAQPFVEMAAVLEEGENHRDVARSLMMDAATVVYAGIGYEVPDKVAQALANGQVPAGSEATTVVNNTTVAAPEATEEAPAADAEDKPKKRRGRPPGTKNTQPKAGTKAAKEQAEKAVENPAEVSDDEIPGGDDKPQISTNPENRVDPADTDGIPGEEDATDNTEVPTDDSEIPGGEDYTAKDLHTYALSLAKEKKLSGPDVKQVLAHFKVARFQDIPADGVMVGKKMIDDMLAAREAK